MTKINKLAITIADIDQIDEEPRYGYSSQVIGHFKELLRQRLDSEKGPLEGWIMDWVISVLNRELPDHYLRRLKWFKSASDELPPELAQGHYKCRGNEISGIGVGFQAMISASIITDNVVLEQIAKYQSYNFSYHRGRGSRTTRVEIDFINETLDIVIRHLEELAKQTEQKPKEAA